MPACPSTRDNVCARQAEWECVHHRTGDIFFIPYICAYPQQSRQQGLAQFEFPSSPEKRCSNILRYH